MSAYSFLLLCVLTRTTILHSKDLQKGISSDFFRPRDLMKMRNVDRLWVNIGEIYKTFTADGRDAAFLENKITNASFFETKENSWNEIELAEQLSTNEEDAECFLKMIQRKDWDHLFVTQCFWDESVEYKFGKFLLENIDANQKYVNAERFCCRPLHCILCDPPNYYLDVALDLIQRGADVNAVDCQGKTALHYAAQWDLVDLIEVLLKHGAKIDATTNLSHTPLMWAAKFGHADSVRLLLQSGADFSRETEIGATALQIAQIHAEDVVGAKACVILLKNEDNKKFMKCMMMNNLIIVTFLVISIARYARFWSLI